MQLTEDQIRRIARREASSVYSRGGGGIGFGGVSAAWVDENYLSKEFFSALFKVYKGSGSSAVEIEPNDDMPTDQSVLNTVNVKSIFGLWTPKFLSALGLGTGGGSGSTSALYNLIDVKPNAGGTMVYGLDGTLADNGKVLTYNATYSKWVAQTIQQSGGVIQSVTLTTPANSGLLVALGSGTPGNTATISTASGTFALSLASGYEMFKPLDYFDASKNAKKANALNVAAAKKVWGQTYLNASGVPQDVSGDLYDVNDIYMDGKAYPTIFIGDDSSYYLKKTTSSGEDFLAVAVNGEKFNFKETMFYSAVEIRTSVGVYSSGYVTALSDIRHKDVCGTPKLTVEDIAQTHPILFTWKDKQKDQSVQAGAIAQEWQKILPEVVRENDGVLSLGHGVAALISSSIIAKRVVNHEQRLQRIEKELFTN